MPGIAAGASEPHWVAELKAPDIRVRRAAIDEIQTLDDPRIAEACLPLLQDQGDSIRRLAARAIGSRFEQIPKERVPVFVEALKECAAQGPEDTTLMARRATGLLTRDYSSQAFSRSPDGQWVLYERRRRPVVANVRTQEHDLLAPMIPPGSRLAELPDSVVEGGNIKQKRHTTRLMKLMVTNEPADDLFGWFDGRLHRPAIRWHPKSRAVAFTPDIQARFFEPLCIWRASDRSLMVWTIESFKPLYGSRFPHWGTVMEFIEWRGDKAVLHIYDCDDPGGGEPFDPKGVRVSVDIATGKIALVD